MDPEEYRSQSRERWASVARGWGDQRERMRDATEPVTRWLLDALDLQPGQTVLEVAAGPGEVGMLAVERVRPGGRLIATDASEEMVALIRERAGAAGDVDARVMEAEWLDLETATVDAVVCRWGYMLLADPGASLRETRRVLRPGGRISLAAWAGPEHNPWSSAIGSELVARGLFERPEPGAPGQFAWSDQATITRELEDAGFIDVRVDTVEFAFAYPDLDEWWDVQLDISPSLAQTVAEISPAERDELRDALDARLAPFVGEEGRVMFPAATHVAAADA